jgi:uncharacterized protein (DUF1499 family)
MTALKIIGLGIVLVAVLACATFLILGPDQFWRFGGDPDLGNVSFETLQRRMSPNDALACPPTLCEAKRDIEPPTYGLSAADLRKAFGSAIASEPRLQRVASDDAALTDRYVQRSRWLGFPDTIIIRFLDRPDGRSTVALYSRSKFGEGDFGVNRARIERWLAVLATVPPPLAGGGPSQPP